MDTPPPSFPRRDVWRDWRAAQARGEPTSVLLKNCRVADVTAAEETVAPAGWVLCEDGLITDLGIGEDYPALRSSAEEGSAAAYCLSLDCGGRLLLPGLCDAHVHATAVSADLGGILSLSESLVTARAVVQLEQMLMRGFTTVRDVGGADWGLALAVEEGSCCGPRLLFVGHALSQTGGHGDMRTRGEECFVCGPALRGIGRVCDGEAECRKAARDELRKGAHCIKIMASGGVASPTDKLTSTQFSIGEMRSIVEEAEAVGTYVCAHAYTPASITRALEAGVRCIEHGNQIDEPTASAIVAAGATLVSTLITYKKLLSDGESSGMPAELVAKVGNILSQGLDALRYANAAGCRVVFGSDLLGAMQTAQCEEFDLRATVESRWQTLRAATLHAARLFQEDGDGGGGGGGGEEGTEAAAAAAEGVVGIGVVAVGRRADLIVVDSIDELSAPERNLQAVVKDGVLVLDRLTAPRGTQQQQQRRHGSQSEASAGGGGAGGAGGGGAGGAGAAL